MRVKYLAQGHYCHCQQIRTGDLTIESPWSYPLSHNGSSRRFKSKAVRNGLNCDSWLILLDWPLIPTCQLDQKDVINFPIFSLPFSFPPCIIQSWYFQPSFPYTFIPHIQMCTKLYLKFRLSRSDLWGPQRFDLGKVDCIFKVRNERIRSRTSNLFGSSLGRNHRRHLAACPLVA